MPDTKKKEEFAKEQFDETWKETEQSEQVTSSDGDQANYTQWMSDLGSTLRKLFDEAEGERRPMEERWIRDLRQYRGEYDPTISAKIHPKRSKAFVGITRTKVKTVSARMTDLLFPPNNEKNWGIDPTPVPDLGPELESQIALKIQQITGKEPTKAEIKKILYDEARDRADKMETEIFDQLSELKYREIIRNTIKSGNIYGTGILKGPLVKEQKAKRWVKGPNTWQTIEIKTLHPYCEFVSLWDIYPDMAARDPEDLRYIFQRHVMNRNKVQGLASRRDFNGDAIREYLLLHPTGDAEVKNFEEDLRNLGTRKDDTQSGTPNRDGKYELREFWGYVNTNDLKNVPGVKIPQDLEGHEVAANIWMLGPIIIKAILSQIEGVTFPFFWYYFDKDETSIFGEGIPVTMRDTQKLINASTRAMIDNAAISAGPIIEANMDLLTKDEDPNDLYPFRVFQRSGVGMEASQKAIHVTSLPSYTNQFMGMINLWMTMADETTSIPRYMHGDNTQVGGAGRTATGLSMLMGAANVTLKDQIKNFDDGITKRFIKAMYFWNMDLNPKTEIKGDFNIIAKGSTSLIAKEVKAEHLNTFLALTNNPVDLQYTNRDVVLREMARSLDLDDLEIIKTKEQIRVDQDNAAKAAEQDRKDAMKVAELKAESGGHVNTDDVPSGSPPPGMESLTPGQANDGQIPRGG